MISKMLTPRVDRVLRVVSRADGAIGHAEIVAAIGGSLAATNEALSILVRSGRIVRVRRGEYALPKKEDRT